MRINEIPDNQADLFSVSAFYSGQLVSFVRRVLDIVPRSMFDKMKAIIQIQTSRLLELPPRLEKVKRFFGLEKYDFACFDASHSGTLVGGGSLERSFRTVQLDKRCGSVYARNVVHG